ncbi:DNA polymerase III, delta prime subunit [Crocosphaera subtropica ATCC 51142]|uniref:DNA polymerase III, delta prime subunit n=1 Tax=Crocosphaera subtropica (strain ATCC 51142 / BH68) TaxID=43989 RepID=B1WTL5_CROS5|nr:DNA polymerase III subunit delta' [Crocosphaera subtropica]ACB53730.1 DNA polymerase III, delta prime subunit [Crocosphaera subtropica ATCC 51142]
MNHFRQLIGQPSGVALLQQAIAKNRIAPAYLFAGPSGVGRALGAKCFTQLLLSLGLPNEKQASLKKRILDGNHPDFYWVEPTYQHQGQLLSAKEAQETGLKRKAPPQVRIEQVRDITQFLSRPPLEASRCVVVIEAAETMTEAAANGLLKTLEEPGKATLILIAPSADSLLPTLVSRCQKIPFYRLSDANLKTILGRLGYEEIVNHPDIIGLSQGSPGEAIAAWEQLQTIPFELRQKLKSLPQNPLDALELAKEITTELDSDSQLWLINYLQYSHWQTSQDRLFLDKLEAAKKQLLSYVQPRLVWDCLFLMNY